MSPSPTSELEKERSLYKKLNSLQINLVNLFAAPFSHKFTRHLACELIGKTLGASSVSMLIYGSYRDRLIVKGRYISPKAIVTTKGESLIEQEHIEYASAYFFIYYNKTENKATIPDKVNDFYQEYKKKLPENAVTKAVFEEIYKKYESWKEKHQQLMSTYDEETYTLHEESITGAYYHTLVDEEIALKESYHIENLSKVPLSQQKCRTILTDSLKIEVQQFDYYLALPLKINDRFFGLLRITLPKGNAIIISKKDKEYQLKPPYEFVLKAIAQLIAKEIYSVNIKDEESRKQMQYMQNMAHQVISPLNALISHGRNLMLMQNLTEDKKRQKIRYMAMLARMAANHARSFQVSMDLVEGKVKPNLKRILDLRLYLIERAIDFQPLAQKKGIIIHIKNAGLSKSAEKFIKAEIDTKLFGHAVFNLFDNAIKYSFSRWTRKEHKFNSEPPSADAVENVIVDVKEVLDEIIITISNCGLAIPENKREEVFKREVRLREAADHAPTGSGIGLYLTKKIVELHGGTIELVPHSTNKHITTFKIMLPKK